jgi:hypothetical protein
MTPLRNSRARLWGALVVAAVAASPSMASRTEVFALEDYGDFAEGELDGLQLGPDGALTLGPTVESIIDGLNAPAITLTRGLDGSVYVATAAPGRIWKLSAGNKKPELLAEVAEPLITALVPMSGDTLAAVTAPKGGVRFISSAGKETGFVAAPDGVELLLDAAVLDKTLYVVGGGEEGVLFSIKEGDKAFTEIAKVEAEHLRSVAARRTRRGDMIVVGTATDGLVYAVKGQRLQALVDASTDEVIDLVIDAGGRVFAALVDTDGKLTEGASALAKADSEEKSGKKTSKKDKKKEKKARKVKSAEVLRLDPDGQVTVLWQSKTHAAYALGELRGQIVVGTGPKGRLYGLDPDGGKRPSILGRAKGADEVVAFTATKVGLMMATAHPGGVQLLTSAKAKEGTFLSAPLDAGATTRLGRLAVDADGGAVKASVRVGNTKEPDETWSPFSSSLLRPGVPAIIGGRYLQVKIEAAQRTSSPRVTAARLAHLVHNRAPELVAIDVVAPGYKVIANQKSQRESRSVSFSRKAFAKFDEHRGSAIEPLKERGGGKQIEEPGWRTIYAWVEDADKDLLRYRFSLRPVGGDFSLIKDWSDEPFVSIDASRLRDGAYEVKVEVDDFFGNGPVRALGDEGVSPRFDVTHSRPTFEAASAAAAKDGVRFRFAVNAVLPLTLVECSVGGGDWVPVDPMDGILDSEVERFDVTLPGAATFGSSSCRCQDEGMNTAKIDLPVR